MHLRSDRHRVLIAVASGLRVGGLVVAFALCGFAAAQPSGDDAPSDADPGVTPAPSDQEWGGLRLPEGVPAEPPAADYVFHTPADGEPLVVRVQAELGEKRLVKLPTGRLNVVARDETAATDEPFVPATDDELIASLAKDGLGDFRTEREGYYLFAYDCTDAYYLHTKSILQSMLRGVVKQLAAWGLRPKRPETPLVVVIFPSRSAFDAFEEMPNGVAAYYNGVTNHVVLYEDDRLFDAAPEFALRQASYVVAHEAIHQLLHNTGIQGRLAPWPAWISEGLPEYFCPLRVHSSLAKTDGDELPIRTVKWSEAGMVNDLRMYDLLRTASQEGDVVRTVVAAPALTAHGYSLAWGLVHYLAERKQDELSAYLADVRGLHSLQESDRGSRLAPDPLFVKHFGEDFAAVESAVQRHLTSRRLQKEYRDPYVNQTHYVVSVTFKRRRVFYTKAGVLLSPAAAREWAVGWRAALDRREDRRPLRDARMPDRHGGGVPHAQNPATVKRTLRVASPLCQFAHRTAAGSRNR